LTAVSTTTREAIVERLKKVHPLLGNAEVVQVDRLQRTIAGKTRMVIRVAFGPTSSAGQPCESC
jgi:hypothetical protein